MCGGAVLIVPVQWENPYTVGDTILRPGILSHAQREKAGWAQVDLRSLLTVDVLAPISLSSCICDVLAMVYFHLELCANEPCLPKLSLTEWSITATGKEADTPVSTPPRHLLPPFLPFSSPPWGRFFLYDTIYPLLLAPAKSLESSRWHSLLSIMWYIWVDAIPSDKSMEHTLVIT